MENLHALQSVFYILLGASWELLLDCHIYHGADMFIVNSMLKQMHWQRLPKTTKVQKGGAGNKSLGR